MSWPDFHLWLLVAALLLDAVIGDPPWLWRQIPHPVVLFGRLIGLLDRRLNLRHLPSAVRRRNGTVALAVVLIVAIGIGLGLETIAKALSYGEFLIVVSAAILIAQRSLYQHVAAIAQPLANGDLEGARTAVSKIVGRDPDALDSAGIARATIESLAENFSDGIVAPAFWFAVFGLPGLIAYKALNTMDSMIGHLTPRHRDFGWAAARLDDWANFLPARLSAAFIALATLFGPGDGRKSIAVIRAEAHRHKSPNAGWPEAAMAGALDIALAGPRTYGERLVSDPYLNEAGDKNAGADDIGRALRLYFVGCVLNLGLYIACALAL